MKFILQLSALAAAALISMASAAPGQKTCHTLSEAHANTVCKEYCGSTGNKSTTVKVHSSTLNAWRPLTTATTSKVSTKSDHSTKKEASRFHPSASKKPMKSVSTISHTRTNNKRHRSTKTTTTYKTVKTTITKTITMKASEASALADRASSKEKKRVTTIYTTISHHRR
ncbi:unnamed protein product [Mucor circinelloides]